LPLIIREERENRQLVGDGYIHGTMGGQVFEEEECQRIWFIRWIDYPKLFRASKLVGGRECLVRWTRW
jgi:hypothetical protein